MNADGATRRRAVDQFISELRAGLDGLADPHWDDCDFDERAFWIDVHPQAKADQGRVHKLVARRVRKVFRRAQAKDGCFDYWYVTLRLVRAPVRVYTGEGRFRRFSHYDDNWWRWDLVMYG